MQDDIKSFVLLKYEILTSNSGTWHLYNNYPIEVRSKWAWRCAADVEHLAKGYPKAEECIRVAKAYRDGLATIEELNDAWLGQPSGIVYNVAGNVAAITVYAARGVLYAAYHAAHSCGGQIGSQLKKWELYTNWLIEELCEWELKQQIPVD